jgi:hypothetical protein
VSVSGAIDHARAVALAGQLAELGEMVLVLAPALTPVPINASAGTPMVETRTLHARVTDLPRELMLAGAGWTLARQDGTILARFEAPGVLTLMLP